MGQFLYAGAIKVVAGAINYSNVSPANTARAIISSPVDCYAQVLHFTNQFPFRPTLNITFVNNPAVGAKWQMGPPPGVDYTWVSGTPVGNQIKRGATVADSINNLCALLSAQGVNYNPSGSYSLVIQPPVTGQGADTGWVYQGQTYLLPASGPVEGVGGAGVFVPAGVPVPIAAGPSQKVWIMGAPGVPTSDPATGNGASVAWESA